MCLYLFISICSFCNKVSIMPQTIMPPPPTHTHTCPPPPSLPPISSVLIGSISVVVKWVLMFTGLMDGIFCCSIFLLPLQYVVSLQANVQHARLFPSPEGWNLAAVSRTRKWERDKPFTICGSVSWTCNKAFCRAICSSLGRQQARLLENRERVRRKEGGLKLEECSIRVSCLRR